MEDLPDSVPNVLMNNAQPVLVTDGTAQDDASQDQTHYSKFNLSRGHTLTLNRTGAFDSWRETLHG